MTEHTIKLVVVHRNPESERPEEERHDYVETVGLVRAETAQDLVREMRDALLHQFADRLI